MAEGGRRSMFDMKDLLKSCSKLHDSQSAVNKLQSDLQTAAGIGDAKWVEECLQDGADPNWVDPRDGNTALEYASGEGYNDIVKLLIKYGANFKKDACWNPLELALQSRHMEVVDTLFRAWGDDDSWVDLKLGYPAFKYAIERGSVKVMKVFIKAGYNINEWPRRLCNYSEIHIPLHMAVETCNDPAEKVAALCEAGARVDHVNDTIGVTYPYTALMRASELGLTDIVKLLIKYKADVNKGNHEWNPLLLAVYHGYKETAEALLQEKADTKWVSSNGFTALMHSSKGLAKLLIQYGADVRQETRCGNALVSLVREYDGDDYGQILESVEALLEAGALIDKPEPAGYTALMRASEIHQPKLVSLLLKFKPDINIVNSRESALYLAGYAADESVVRLLLLHDASVRPQFYPVMCDGKQITYEIPDHLYDCFSVYDDSGILYASGAKRFKYSRTNQVVTNDLQSWCREVIREQLLSPVGGNHNNLLTAIPQLPLPGKLKKYIVYYDHILGSATSTSESAAEFIAKAVAREDCEIIHAAIRRPPKVYPSLP